VECAGEALLPTLDLIIDDKERATTMLTPLISVLLPHIRQRG